MARPLKSGVDYFPLDTNFMQDKKIQLIRAEFGAKGIAILIELFCEIYGQNGYFKPWDGDDCFLMADAVGCGCSPQNIEQVVQGCLRRSIFDDGVFQVFGVLTSAGIQRRYIRMFPSRKTIAIIQEYWLLNEQDDDDVPASVLGRLAFKSLKNIENPDKNIENPLKNIENPIKEKESKVKEIKVKESMPQQVFELYNTICQRLPPCKEIPLDLEGQYTLEDYRRLFELAQASDFLAGKSKGGWKADFDWLIQPDHMKKVFSGKYQNAKPKNSAAQTGSESSIDMDKIHQMLHGQTDTR